MFPSVSTPSVLRRSSAPKWLGTAGAASLALHLSALGVLAAWSADRWLLPPRLGATPGVAVIEARFSESEPAPTPVEFTIPTDDVVILPHEATVANRRFVDTPSARVPLEKFLTRDVLDRLLAPPETAELSATNEMQKESQPLAMATSTPQEQPIASRPASSRRPVTPVQAELQPERSTPADAGVRTGPSFAGNRPPSFPAIARRNGWEGRVLLRLFINAEGAVTRVEVVRSSGHEVLDAEAVATLRTWRGTPATLNGRPVETVVLQSIRFVPRNR